MTFNTMCLLIPFANGTTGILQPHRDVVGAGILWCATATIVEENHICIPVISATSTRWKLRKHFEIGKWTPMDSTTFQFQNLELLDHVALDTVISRLKELLEGALLTDPVPGEVDIALGMQFSEDELRMPHFEIRQFPDVFATGTYAPGAVQGVECNIDTADHKPIHEKRCWYTPKQTDVIKTQLQEMLDIGIIEPGHSQWGFPVALVKKRMVSGASVQISENKKILPKRCLPNPNA